MPVNKFVIAVVLQKIYAVLHNRGCNQAVNGIADGDAIAPDLAINRRAELKRGTVVFEVNQVFKLPFGGGELLSVTDALQHFGENETTTAKVVAVVDALRELLCLRGVSSVEEINPDGGINQDSHAVRVRRMAFKLPVH